MKAPTPVLGIDLGTTYSCVAYVDESGKSVIIKNHEGERTTPSVVSFEDGTATVGSTAKEAAKNDPHNVVSFVKRRIGKDDGWYYATSNGKKVGPEEISAYILKKLVADASAALGQEVTDVVITVPAYFGINEREATKRAGIIAGLNVLGIIAEPIAAAFAYGTNEERKNVLVYDLGGGTFDVTVIRFTPQCFESVIVKGDHELGGKDWDERITRYLISKFCEMTDADPEEMAEDLEVQADLQDIAERVVKKQLSTQQKATARVIYDAKNEKIEITREQFEELTADLLGRTIDTVREAISDAAAKGVTTIDEIILVGGSSKMPQVRRAMEENFSIPVKLFDPDESVARGAAIVAESEKLLQSYSLLGDIVEQMGEGQTPEDVYKDLPPEQKEMLKTIAAEQNSTPQEVIGKVMKKYETVCSKSFGIVVIDTDTDEERVANLVVLNSRLPVEVERTFPTYSTGDKVDVNVMENLSPDGSASLAESRELNTSALNFGTILPAGSPISVTFILKKDGTLEVTALDVTQGKSIDVVIATGGNVIDGEELNEAIARTAALAIN